MAITTNFMHIIMFHSSNFIKSSVTNLSVDLITKNDSLCLRKLVFLVFGFWYFKLGTLIDRYVPTHYFQLIEYNLVPTNDLLL